MSTHSSFWQPGVRNRETILFLFYIETEAKSSWEICSRSELIYKSNEERYKNKETWGKEHYSVFLIISHGLFHHRIEGTNEVCIVAKNTFELKPTTCHSYADKTDYTAVTKKY